jgi:16S rRNA (uracil1498-N3)-methyltransferase
VLAQALLKGEKMDLVIQKCTEIGVSSIALLNTERTIIDIPHKKLPDRLTRWQRIAKEASEQSGRTRIPSIQGPFSLSQLIEQQSKLGPVLIPWEKESLPLAIATEPLKHQSPRIITLIVGPEGGFSEKEVTNAQKLGATSVSLGPRILRAETAALIASALVLHLLGE